MNTQAQWFDNYLASRATSKRALASLKMLDFTNSMKTQDLTPKNGTITRIDPGIEDRIQKFISWHNHGAQTLDSCAQQLVELVALEPKAFDLIIERDPNITLDTLNTLYLCGKKGIAPRLVMDRPDIMKRLLPLPTETLHSVISQGLPVVRSNGSGDCVSTVKPFSQLTRHDVAKAVGPEGIRSAPEQIKVAAEREKHLKKNRPRYSINADGAVTFYHNSTFTCAEIESIAKQCLEKAKASLAKKK